MNAFEFVESGKRSAWIEDMGINAYLRRSFRILKREVGIEQAIDVASVELVRGPFRTGAFSRFLVEVEIAASRAGLPVFVENVMHDWLYAALLRRGYMPSVHDGCVYKRT